MSNEFKYGDRVSVVVGPSEREQKACVGMVVGIAYNELLGKTIFKVELPHFVYPIRALADEMTKI